MSWADLNLMPAAPEIALLCATALFTVLLVLDLCGWTTANAEHYLRPVSADFGGVRSR
jgi:hypothetical protein